MMVMIFYEVEIKSIPEFLFACSTNYAEYKHHFHRVPDFMEIAIIEEGRVISTNADGSWEMACPGMLSSCLSDRDFESVAYNGERQRHTTVGVNVKYNFKRRDSKDNIDVEELKKNVKEGKTVLIPFHENVDPIEDSVKLKIKNIINYLCSSGYNGRLSALSEWFSLCAMLSEFVIHKLDSSNANTSPAAMKYVSKAQEYIKENYKKNITIEELAQNLKISSGYLHSIFKAVSGMSVIEYINSYRVEMVKQMIRRGDISLRDASLNVGISDPSYMSRLFKKVSGISFKEFRDNELLE
ncbi:MAG: helix-turn-helix transcriptional regulator [Clostridia bacterium]|nr:helix-turn-helix transcriptional regulator [Clostridia bacterium]